MNRRQASHRIVAASEALQSALAAAEHVCPEAAQGLIRQADYEVVAATGRCVDILAGRVPAPLQPVGRREHSLEVGEQYLVWVAAGLFTGRLLEVTETDWLLEEVSGHTDGNDRLLEYPLLTIPRGAVQMFARLDEDGAVDEEELEDATDSEVREVMRDLMCGAGGRDGATASERFEVAKRRVTARYRRMAVVADRVGWDGFASRCGIDQ